MEKLEHLSCFIHNVVTDTRLTPVHQSVCFAFTYLWMEKSFPSSYSISRRVVMKISGIKSIVTYHKVIKDLKSFGHIIYQPSYHPLKGSKISLVINMRHGSVDSRIENTQNLDTLWKQQKRKQSCVGPGRSVKVKVHA